MSMGKFLRVGMRKANTMPKENSSINHIKKLCHSFAFFNKGVAKIGERKNVH
jgi:hypothetical protein